MDLQELRKRLKKAHLTQVVVAAHLGVTHSQVSRLLAGKTRMRVDDFAKIEALLREAERNRTAGVAETADGFRHRRAGVPWTTLEEAKALRDKPRVRMSAQERERWMREIAEIGEVGRTLPRVTDLTDDEILGYDEMP